MASLKGLKQFIRDFRVFDTFKITIAHTGTEKILSA